MTLELSEAAALQASSATKKVGEVTQEDLEGVAEEHAEVHWGNAISVVCGEFVGLLYEYDEGPSTWRRWFLRKGPVLLFFTYNGTPEAQVRERSAVEQVLASARLKEPE